MGVEARVIDKYKMAYGTEVEVNYTCPHCGENVTETICFSDNLTSNCIAVLDDHQCYECGEDIELEVDFY